MTETTYMTLLHWEIAEYVFYFRALGAALQRAMNFLRTLRRYMRSNAPRADKYRMVKLWRSIQMMFVEVR